VDEEGYYLVYQGWSRGEKSPAEGYYRAGYFLSSKAEGTIVEESRTGEGIRRWSALGRGIYGPAKQPGTDGTTRMDETKGEAGEERIAVIGPVVRAVIGPSLPGSRCC